MQQLCTKKDASRIFSSFIKKITLQYTLDICYLQYILDTCYLQYILDTCYLHYILIAYMLEKRGKP